MSRKIKLHTFQILFQLFDFLADRTGGWSLFVRPKILIGSLIMGFGITIGGGGTIEAKEKTKESKPANFNEIKKLIKDSWNSSSNINNTDINKNDSEIVMEVVSCYMTKIEPEIPDNGIELIKTINEQIAKNFRYPNVAFQNNTQDKIICLLKMNELGEITSINILKGISELMDKETVRVLHQIQKLTPARMDGINVKFDLIVPISFNLPK